MNGRRRRAGHLGDTAVVAHGRSQELRDRRLDVSDMARISGIALLINGWSGKYGGNGI